MAEYTNEELLAMVCELETQLLDLEDKFSRGKTFKPGRKEEVLAVLEQRGRASVDQIAKDVGISHRNVSSQLSYLRRDGFNIGTDSKGRKFIEE